MVEVDVETQQARFGTVKRMGARLAELVLSACAPLLVGGRQPRDRGALESILVVEPYGLGDLVVASGFIAALHRMHPAAAIGVVCDERWAEFASELPGVRKVHANSYPWATGRWTRRNMGRLLHVARTLRQRKYDLGIDIRGDIRSQALLLVAGCPHRVGFSDYMGSTIDLRGSLLTAHTRCGVAPRLEELQRLLALVPGGHSAPPLRIEIHHSRESVGAGGPLRVGIHAGASHQSKRWPVSRWRVVVEALALQPEISVTFLGTPAEQPTLRALAAGVLPGESVRTCRTVRELIDAVAELDLLVCLDSAPFHIAAGTDTPAIALFGPGQPRRWSHAGAREIILRPAAYARRRSAGDAKQLTPEDLSVEAITPDEVLAAIGSLLSANRGLRRSREMA